MDPLPHEAAGDERSFIGPLRRGMMTVRAWGQVAESTTGEVQAHYVPGHGGMGKANLAQSVVSILAQVGAS